MIVKQLRELHVIGEILVPSLIQATLRFDVSAKLGESVVSLEKLEIKALGTSH